MDVTRDELVRAVQLALQGTPEQPDGALTIRELCQVTGRGKDAVRAVMITLKQQGLIEHVTVYRENLIGLNQPVPGYRTRQRQAGSSPADSFSPSNGPGTANPAPGE